MSTSILWSSISFKDNQSEIKKYNKLRNEFNSHFEEFMNSDKTEENTNTDDNDSENKLLLEKINNYIKIYKEDNLDFKNMNILEILKEEESICTYLCKYVLQNNYLNFDFFTNTLNVLRLMSQF